MITDLFAAVSALPSRVVAGAVPPSCRQDVESAPPFIVDGDDAVMALSEWPPRRPAVHFVPSLSALTTAGYGMRFELSVRGAGAWSPWVGATALGSAIFAPIPTRAEIPGSAGMLASDIDLFVTDVPVERVRLRLRVGARDAGALSRAPLIVTLSACDGGATGSDDSAAVSARLEVPPLSQVEEGGEIGPRICSPVSVAMVLRYWGRDAGVGPLAAEMFHPLLDLYGVWPAAIRAAGRRGVPGYLLRFPGWAAAAWCLDHGLPLVASVRYQAGELTGAAIAETPGHLLVLTGHEGGDVFVNDPAAPTRASVARRYRREELERVWLGRAGVGYVLFPA